uniref:caldesmon, smooth muscle isoform X2 n=1 Tax=Pristiophorus japonicus TaxID=55135 RepID=UPI00398EF7A4
MTSAVFRRGSSKEGLKNLLRLTAQRSMEDEEEIARERRRRAREERRYDQDDNGSYTSSTSSTPVFESLRATEENQEDLCQTTAAHHPGPGTLQRNGYERPKENEIKLSHMAMTWTEHSSYEEENDVAAQDKMASYHGYRTTKTILSEFPETDEDGELTRLEAEQKLEQIRRSLDEKENQEYERLRQQGHDAELELEELKKKREDRRKLREEEDLRRQQQEQELQAREEEEKRRMREEREKRRMEAAEKRQKVLSISGSEMDDPFLPLSPRSPTFKKEFDDGMASEATCLISERTESLNRSLKKSNSVKKSQPITSISKIDERLEQYTSAIESTTKLLRHSSLDMPNLSEDVATKKSLWETGDAAGSPVTKGTPCKDTEGLKVGVGDLINQWVSKSPEPSTWVSPSKPAEIKPGDVRSKKNIWENKTESQSVTKSASAGKNHPSAPRYKFVVTGHGKYEKVPITDDEHGANANSQSTGVEHYDKDY